jgi:hypothetical protein
VKTSDYSVGFRYQITSAHCEELYDRGYQFECDGDEQRDHHHLTA